MQRLLLVTVLSVFVWPSAQGQQKKPCEVDLGGPILPAYLCAEQLAKDAATRVEEELKTTLVALQGRLQQGGPYVSKKQLQLTQEKWSAHIREHCQFVSQIPGTESNWQARSIYENTCLARESALRIAQLQVWRACFSEGGGQCLP